jgi:hypothetical protein
VAADELCSERLALLLPLPLLLLLQATDGKAESWVAAPDTANSCDSSSGSAAQEHRED